MGSQVLYQSATGWVTIHISPYHTWQGYISDIPNVFLGYIFEVVQLTTCKSMAVWANW